MKLFINRFIIDFILWLDLLSYSFSPFSLAFYFRIYICTCVYIFCFIIFSSWNSSSSCYLSCINIKIFFVFVFFWLLFLSFFFMHTLDWQSWYSSLWAHQFVQGTHVLSLEFLYFIKHVFFSFLFLFFFIFFSVYFEKCCYAYERKYDTIWTMFIFLISLVLCWLWILLSIWIIWNACMTKKRNKLHEHFFSYHVLLLSHHLIVSWIDNHRYSLINFLYACMWIYYLDE